jgi:hypothetical protein
MSISEFIDSLKKNKKTSELNNLYKKPFPEKRTHTPQTQVFYKNIYHQADILYMPDDDGYKYILSVVDLYDGACDSVPLKVRDNHTVINAFQKIYGGKYLKKYPWFITLDMGSEFLGDTKKFFQSHNTIVKYALVGRHRMVATVERLNQKIQDILFKRMTSEELLTGEVSKQWVKDLPELIKIFNERKKKPLDKSKNDILMPELDEYTGNLLPIGTKVRVKLDYPIDTVGNKRLSGTFRTSDIKWSPKIYEITQVLLTPNKPPMYLCSKDDNIPIPRIKNEFLQVSKKIKEPDAKFIRTENPEYYIVAEILDKRKNNKKDEYLVRWKGFKTNEATWISGKELNRTRELKEMKREFNRQHNN